MQLGIESNYSLQDAEGHVLRLRNGLHGKMMLQTKNALVGAFFVWVIF